MSALVEATGVGKRFGSLQAARRPAGARPPSWKGAGMQVREGMSPTVLMVGPEHSLRAVARLMSIRRVGAAVVPQDRRVYKIRDSKLLTEHEREALFDRIASWCVTWAVGHASVEECAELGMADAQRLAARRALDGLGVPADRVLLDGNWDFVGGGRTQRLVRGDARCLSVAAASILAKVSRDRIMRDLAESFPGYDFELNKGYPCPRHKAALRAWGPTTIHRRSWAFMESLAWGTRLVRPPDPSQMGLAL